MSKPKGLAAGGITLSMADIRRRYLAKRRRADRLKDEIARLEAELKRGSVNWIDALVKPVGKALAKATGRTLDVLGPFGLGAEVAIHLYKPGVTDEDKFAPGNCLSITFRPGRLHEAKLFLVDRSRKTNRYPNNSLGDINGLNHPDIPIPDDAGLDWFLECLS
jgi:hypothetical protein